ncbi:plasmodesmata-located protein 4-like [Solanum dulcamara]|uniref:plasmodesmata-located protein 4-like n=1 Tax=Solanum dulcamara TaxID=45834 RepID=UPI002485303B|nr:plasmodesmata-located protein 4-like [Solanum dulcamara]
MLHKVCSKKRAKSRSFLEEMSYAFAEIVSCGMNENGFCDLSVGKVHVMAQCVGNLGDCDCGACVNKAVQIVHDECSYSLAGEIYLDGCYLSYNYGKNKVSSHDLDEGKGYGNGRQKLAAIVAGGIVATILLGVVYYFLKSCGKKDDDYW